MKIPDFVRIIIAELGGMLVAFWAGVAMWHYFAPPKDAWFGTAWAFTCAFVGVMLGIGFAFSVWRATSETGAEHG
jgi:hypothetical protein